MTDDRESGMGGIPHDHELQQAAERAQADLADALGRATTAEARVNRLTQLLKERTHAYGMICRGHNQMTAGIKKLVAADEETLDIILGAPGAGGKPQATDPTTTAGTPGGTSPTRT